MRNKKKSRIAVIAMATLIPSLCWIAWIAVQALALAIENDTVTFWAALLLGASSLVLAWAIMEE